MESNYLIRLSANASSPVKTGIKLKYGDSGQALSIAVEGINTTNTTAKIAFKRPNGAVSVESSITAVNGVYNYMLQGNELGEFGLVVADLKFYEGTKRVSTASFIFEVIPDTMDGIHTPTAKVDKTLMEQYLDEMTLLNQQTSSSASAAQASASIAQVAATQLTAASTGRLSNENLLDNPFFTVNQRQGKIAPYGTALYSDAGLTQFVAYANAAGPVVELTATYAKMKDITVTAESYYYVKASDVVDGYIYTGGTQFCWDRWKCFNGNTYIKNGVVHLARLQQSIESTRIVDGAQYTASVLFEDGIIGKVSGVLNKSISNWQIAERIRPNFFLGIQYETAGWRFQIQNENNADYAIKAIKLELGSVSTLANDVAPNYALELAKCQRYFRRIEGLYGSLDSAGVIEYSVPLAGMRVAPTVTVKNAQIFNGSWIDTSVAAAESTTTAVRVRLSGGTSANVARCNIDLSADL